MASRPKGKGRGVRRHGPGSADRTIRHRVSKAIYCSERYWEWGRFALSKLGVPGKVARVCRQTFSVLVAVIFLTVVERPDRKQAENNYRGVGR